MLLEAPHDRISHRVSLVFRQSLAQSAHDVARLDEREGEQPTARRRSLTMALRPS
jgi:hypothetical protein